MIETTEIVSRGIEYPSLSVEGAGTILTPAAPSFVATLEGRLGARRLALLDRRREIEGSTESAQFQVQENSADGRWTPSASVLADGRWIPAARLANRR